MCAGPACRGLLFRRCIPVSDSIVQPRNPVQLGPIVRGNLGGRSPNSRILNRQRASLHFNVSGSQFSNIGGRLDYPAVARHVGIEIITHQWSGSPIPTVRRCHERRNRVYISRT